MSEPLVRLVGFGDRNAFESGGPSKEILTLLPEDFGTKGYAKRRTDAIEHHISTLFQYPGEIEWLFDYWLESGKDFLQYLWAHRDENVESARQLINILPSEAVCQILRYLLSDYWGRYLGWPDLLAYRDNEYFFVEVKSSRDKLSPDQKDWIQGNYEELKLPFKIVKVHRSQARG